MYKKKKINSRAKGAGGEREVANYLTSKGFLASRGVQYQGGVESPDVVCDKLKDFHLEVKRTEKTNIYEWMDQAVRDSKMQKTPVVIHRRNAQPWVAILLIDDFLRLAEHSVNLKEILTLKT